VDEDIEYRWRFPVTDEEVNALTRSYGGVAQAGWWDRIRPHSLGWVTAHLADGTVIGFVNVAWDGSATPSCWTPRRDRTTSDVGSPPGWSD
jgi:hypothetical protein